MVLRGARSITRERKATSFDYARVTTAAVGGVGSGIPASSFLFFTAVSALVTRRGVLRMANKGKARCSLVSSDVRPLPGQGQGVPNLPEHGLRRVLRIAAVR